MSQDSAVGGRGGSAGLKKTDYVSGKISSQNCGSPFRTRLIDSWSWFAHFLGGEYRRLLVADGADNNAVLTARDNVIEWMSEESPGLAGESSGVCNGHTDYLRSIEGS